MRLWPSWDTIISPGTSATTFPGIMMIDSGSTLSRLHMVDKMFKSIQRISMVLITAVLVFVTSSGVNNDVLGRCPKECQCFNLQVDCSQRGLNSVPRGIPRNAEKM